jgi:hypothetical protein
MQPRIEDGQSAAQAIVHERVIGAFSAAPDALRSNAGGISD